MKLRPAQTEILKYTSGRMAISAVPGSGKTFVLTRLAAKLIADGRLEVDRGQQVLVVTYLNASVGNFKARIANFLDQMGRPQMGYDVRTLHSLAREILLSAPTPAGVVEDFPVLDEGQSALYRARAVDAWIQDHPAAWYAFLPENAADSPRMRTRWRNITERTAGSFIRLAKNGRYSPNVILDRLAQIAGDWEIGSDLTDQGDPTDHYPLPVSHYPLLAMLTGIYARYQTAVETQGAMDFNDLVWRAADLLERNPGVVEALQQRWPYILEDEAQDSVPLQETLLETLTGPAGNWVRVGDPNQAITSSFTSAHPRFFRAFLARPDVVERPLPESGRSSRKIIGLANRLVEWACAEHPAPEVRESAFRLQVIQPAPAGDGQPNPPDSESCIGIRVYRHREQEELPTVAKSAWERCQQHPQQTVAILAPTNQAGYAVAEHLDALKADYDELLRGSGRTREIAAALHAVLALLAHPLSSRRLEASMSALLDMEVIPAAQLAPADRERLLALMRSVYRPEALLYPRDQDERANALPPKIATPADQEIITTFVEHIRTYFEALTLSPDALVLTLADELFRQDSDLAVAYQISGHFRTLMDANPSWRLPELAAQLEDVAAGSVQLMGIGPLDFGFEPKPGRITLTTQHRAKGLEWDTVYLVGIDNFWIPGHLDAPFLGVHDFLGGDPSAEAAAQFQHLMQGQAQLLPGLTATQTTHIEVIAERLRLLYVGITRAQRNLFISRSRAVTTYSKERDTGPTTALGILYEYLKGLGKKE